MDLGLHGKVVLVTGGAGRIGPTICATFAREGAAVGVVDVAVDRADATAGGLRAAGAQAIGIGADVSRKDDVARAVERVTAAFGPVDVLVNAHGVAPNRLLLEADVEEWDHTFAVNTRGTMLT
jgi:3-oxoacyl-[acyl-carrier protein] reductase